MSVMPRRVHLSPCVCEGNKNTRTTEIRDGGHIEVPGYLTYQSLHLIFAVRDDVMWRWRQGVAIQNPEA